MWMIHDNTLFHKFGGMLTIGHPIGHLNHDKMFMSKFLEDQVMPKMTLEVQII